MTGTFPGDGRARRARSDGASPDWAGSDQASSDRVSSGGARSGQAGSGRLSSSRARHDPAGPDPAGPDPAGPDQTDPEPDPVDTARQICLRLLTAAPRTRAQLADALRRRRVPDAAAEEVLGRFAEARLIDDAAFARAWVESRHHGRGLARRALAAELRRRGVDTEEVQAAVETLSPDEELATARRLAVQRAASSRGRPQPARIRQLVGMLARKGYPAGMAYQVVREVLAEERPGESMIDLDDVPENAAGDEWAQE